MRTFRSLLLLIAGLALAQHPVAAAAKEGRGAAAAKTYLFNIPAQSLSSALEAFGIVTGHQVIYDSRVAQARRSMRVVGVFEPEAALRILLAGTDLAIRYTGPRDVAIVSVAPGRLRRKSYEVGRGVAAGSPVLEVGTLYVAAPRDRVDAVAASDYTAYGRILKTEIRRALDADQETARRSYHVQYDVWIERDGRIGRTDQLRSSGKARLDREIRRVVARIVVSQPPPGAMPQPVRISILAL